MATRRLWRRAALALAGVALASDAAATAVTPVQKVIQLLDGMLVKAKEEKNQEAVQYAAYKQFCSDTETEKARSIKSAEDQISLLQASIQTSTTNAENLAREVEELDNNIATWSADQKAAAKIRETERAEYTRAHEEYTQTIDAVAQAVQVLKTKALNAKQAPQQEAVALIAQRLLAFGKTPKVAQRALTAFLSQDPGEPAVGEAWAYESRSGDIIELLQGLRDKFVEERTTLEKEETARRHAFEMEAEDLKSSIKNAENSRAAKVQERAKEMQSASAEQGELADATSTKADDTLYLNDLKATCQKKATDFEERQKMRAGEIEAITKAIEILSGDQVSGASEKYLALAQRSLGKRGTALLQLASAVQNPNQARAADWLASRGSALGSRVLSALALRAREDPFKKVKQMIQDLITRLQESASQEASHETWCRSELASNKQVRESRETTVNRLKSEIEGKNSALSTLAEQLSKLTEQLASVDMETGKLTELRNEERATNEQTIKDAKDAQMAVSQAVVVLREFYTQAGQATALVQKRHVSLKQEPPPIFDSPYKGLQAENGGVIGILEVIQSDFAQLEATTTAAENIAQKEYNDQMQANAVLKAQLSKDIDHNKLTSQQTTQALADLNNDLTSAEQELAAANAYFEKLKPSCIDAGMSFEERNRRRQEEIESLQEALRILNGEDLSAGVAM